MQLKATKQVQLVNLLLAQDMTDFLAVCMYSLGSKTVLHAPGI